jgi:hypothetical protein
MANERTRFFLGVVTQWKYFDNPLFVTRDWPPVLDLLTARNNISYDEN